VVWGVCCGAKDITFAHKKEPFGSRWAKNVENVGFCKKKMLYL
jgi:hypothetical protein